VDKPAGPTSHDVVAVARRALDTRRIGHAGTLDPFATGLLTLLVGPCTRLAPYLSGLDKRYEAEIHLGVTTTTDDRTGRVLGERPWNEVDDGALAAAVAALVGTITQVPPVYSAKQVGGRRAHLAARAGRPLALAAREVQVHALTIRARRGPLVTIAATVGSGTYVRALARDLGEALGCGAHLAALRRVGVGSWRVEQAVPLEHLVAGVPLLPPTEAVRHLPQRHLSPEEAAAVRHGRPVPDTAAPGPVALVRGEELVAVALADGAALRPAVVLAA
jgi:tRNA pseudouridine55 synthase